MFKKCLVDSPRPEVNSRVAKARAQFTAFDFPVMKSDKKKMFIIIYNFHF
jgi:hypothetical protein